MSKHLVNDLAADPSPDIALPDVIFTADYDAAKYLFSRAVETAAKNAKVFNRSFYWLTYKSNPTSALEVRAHAKAIDDLLTRWDRPATKDRVQTALSQMATVPAAGDATTPEALRATLEAAAAFLRRWLPLADKIIAAKSRVTKGRKPSATPRKTKERTTENTGTCACCGKNVKLDNGRIVMHGFTIRPGWRSGRCFGVGYSPIETGKDGLEAYLNALTTHRDQTTKIIAELQKLDPSTALERTPYQQFRTVGAKLSNEESELLFTQVSIRETEKRIREWEPKPLPK